VTFQGINEALTMQHIVAYNIPNGIKNIYTYIVKDKREENNNHSPYDLQSHQKRKITRKLCHLKHTNGGSDDESN
jgi:hypothetical protein